MSPLLSLLVLMALLALGFIALFCAFVFVTHLVEMRPVSDLVPAPGDDPERDKNLSTGTRAPTRSVSELNPYASPSRPDDATEQNRATAALGFTSHGLFVHGKRGQYKVHTALWVSPDRDTLVVIGWGTIAGLNASKTRLDSRLVDGHRLVMGRVVVSVVLFTRGSAQPLLRLGLFGFTTPAIVGVWLLKLMFRQRSS